MTKTNMTVSLDRIIFESPGGYRIVKCVEISTLEEIILVGHFQPLYDNEEYEVSGVEKSHPKYGLQIEVEKISKKQIKETDKLIEYFSSGLFFGIGKSTAKKIVDKLGEEAITKILDDENVLDDILSQRKKTKFANKLQELNSTDNIYNYLIGLGINQKYATRIYSDYGDEITKVLDDDPYNLYYSNKLQYPFSLCDTIRKNLLVSEEDVRVSSVNLYRYINEKTFETGDTYLLKEFLDLDVEVVSYLKNKFLIYEDDKIITTSDLYNNEKLISKFILDGSDNKIKDEFSTRVDYYVERSSISYNVKQVEAIKSALTNKVSVITGGPGTGKTTIIKAICDIYEDKYNQEKFETIFERELVLVAPTGRAAKRMNEQTLIPASTIHRYLKWDRENNSFHYGVNELAAAKFLIIDEFSMVDVNLFASIIAAVKPDTQIVLLGDDKQLPAVGCGNNLENIIDSNKVPVVFLDEVYRQDDLSLINFMHSIRGGEVPEDLLVQNNARNFFQCHTNLIVKTIEKVAEKFRERNELDYQILVPMYKGVAGIDKINSICQNICNPESKSKRELKVNNVNIRVGDKVLITQNFPNDNVYNGDIGIVCNVNVNGKYNVEIEIDDRKVLFEGEDVYALTHGYAISIHKSQGSEFENVIIPISTLYYRMLKHNLIYTAITRAKKTLLLIGEVSAFENAVLVKDVEKRKSLLIEFLLNRRIV